MVSKLVAAPLYSHEDRFVAGCLALVVLLEIAPGNGLIAAQPAPPSI
jgi:hypothetical protein